MTEHKTIENALDFEVLRRGIEDLDAELLTNLYAEDAEWRFVSRDAPPSSPYLLKGKQEIVDNYRKVFEAQDITQRVQNEVIREDRLALTVAAEYSDGRRELCANTVELDEDGKISRHTIILVRDE
jgi:ketosteroid isomerase-like protein